MPIEQAEPTRRAYDSTRRRQQAAERRDRVVEAAAATFEADGYAGTTLKVIATAAGVSVDTVRAAGSKDALLLEAFRTRYAGAGGWLSLLERDDVRAMFEIDDRAEGIRVAADWLAAAHAGSARLWTIVRTTALTQPAVAEGFAEMSRLKEESFGETTRWLARIGVVPDPGADADVRHALVASVNLVMSAETFLLLTEDYALDLDDYRAWVRDELETWS